MIDGVENLTSLLGDNDNYNMHDSQIRTINYDMVNQTMDVTVEVIGSHLSSSDYDIFMDMHFSNIIAVNMRYADYQYIDEMRIYKENGYITCDFDCVFMQVTCCTLKIDPIRFEACKEE